MNLPLNNINEDEIIIIMMIKIKINIFFILSETNQKHLIKSNKNSKGIYLFSD